MCLKTIAPIYPNANSSHNGAKNGKPFLRIVVFYFICIFFFRYYLFKSIFCIKFASFNLVKHEACVVEHVDDSFVGQIGYKGRKDFPI